MKRILFILCLSFSFFGTAQNDFSEAEAKQLIDTFFEGFHKGDTLMMRGTLAKDVKLQTAFTDKEGTPHLSTGPLDRLLTSIANRPAEQKWDERLLDYKVSIDGNLAHVWTPYEFWVNDTFSHCGANAFTLAKMEDGWKIIHLIDSRRRSSCNKG
ncbi:nuclear transport factor 2 family protein [Aureisphaera galaxeae]|uniref:nuclear transport factor 2 family protein n=1 Tax=Aureisphaera galaxeae TaxID=1538023 RepID=UPI0023507578|nr:nuclear transport factor 2 family protein [Aureisphaera galaxeae]MDC8004660.1 nuclear transport factor 2 family protein [Aureisphaera galaxeae]